MIMIGALSSSLLRQNCIRRRFQKMEVIDKWVAEFFIRRQKNPRVSQTNLLSSLNLRNSPDVTNLKISSILRDISNSLIKGKIDESTLDLLETLENVQQHSLLMKSHESAYCWTAVECTVKFMWTLSASDGLFSEAVDRIWTKRIGVLKEKDSYLVTDELLKWETDLRNAVEDREVYQRIRESNIRYTAVSFLTQLVKEQWGMLGSSSLELVAQRIVSVGNRGEANDVDETTSNLESGTSDNVDEGTGSNGDVEGVGYLEDGGVDKVNEQEATEEEEETIGAQEQGNEPSLGNEEQGGDGNGNNRDVDVVRSIEDDGVDKVNEEDATEEEQTMGAQEQGHDLSVDNEKQREDRNGNSRDVEEVICLEGDGVDKVNEQDATEEEQTIDAREKGREPCLDKGDAAVAKELKDYLLEIQQHLDHSTRQLEEPNEAIDHSVDVTPQPANVNDRIKESGQDHTEPPVDVTPQNDNVSDGIKESGEDHTESPRQDNVNEKGSSSRGKWSGRVRPRRESPVSLNVSPLKKGNSNIRRPKKFWTPEEVKALREGVKEYGKSWKDIKNANPAVFGERTEVDLKDKWRNLVR